MLNLTGLASANLNTLIFQYQLTRWVQSTLKNLTAELELESKWGFVKASSQVNPGLEGGYIDLCGAVGLNFTSGLFEPLRYYIGIRGGTIIREGGHPLFGYEAGVDVNITESFFMGLRGTYDYRSDMEFWGTEPMYRFNGTVRIGYKF